MRIKDDVAYCRMAAERCRTNAAASATLNDTDAWLDLASDWTALAEAFEEETRPRWLN
jgi:hypothetical protein